MKNKNSGLGRAIKNKIDRKKQHLIGDKNPIFFQQTEENQAQIKQDKIKSIVKQNALNQYLQIAEMSQQQFKADRDIKFSQIRQEIKDKKFINVNTHLKQIDVHNSSDQGHLENLQMPKRPLWNRKQTKKQFQDLQIQSYLNWRRTLSQVEESNPDLQITPYQKNIEIWRQLWRVIDRVHLLVQIVDGRDPLFYISQDLIKHVKSVESIKKTLLLINKSDLVSAQTRQRWNQYFIKHQIDHLFFTTKQTNKSEIYQQSIRTQQSENQQVQIIINQYINQPYITTSKQLLKIFQCYTKVIKLEKIQIGLVGYPNVGKSSIINNLFGKKRVGVASMPGKTKHFQTLILTQSVTLCDCPGLVFPRISSSFGEMILNGLYPIDFIKQYHEAMNIIIRRISQKQLNQIYAIQWKQEEVYDVETTLTKYAKMKGFYTGSGLPNQSIAARMIFKDYVSGILLYNKQPPRLIKQEEDKQFNLQKKVYNKQLNNIKKDCKIEKELDCNFFQKIQQNHQNDELIKMLNMEDIISLIQGRKVQYLKVNKEIRKQLKHAIKRGQSLETIKKKYLLNSKKSNKQIIKG